MNKLEGYRKQLFTGEKIRLRAVSDSDKELFAKWWNEDSILLGNRNFIFPTYESENRNLFETWSANSGHDGFGLTIENNLGEVVGILNVFNLKLPVLIAMVGIFIGPEFQGQGFGYEAMRKAVEISFKELNAHKVEINVYSYNQSAIKLYEKVGFIHEGRRRHASYHNGEYFDVLTMGILRDEFEL